MFWSAAALCVLTVAPQQPESDLPRAKAFGIVRDHAGDPWSGVRVRLFSRPLAADPRVGRLDDVETESDASGEVTGTDIKIGTEDRDRVSALQAMQRQAGSYESGSSSDHDVHSAVP